MRIVRICVYTGDVNQIDLSRQPFPPPQASTELSARIPFIELSAGRREVFIEHAGQVYRLSLTAQNKLILTK